MGAGSAAGGGAFPLPLPIQSSAQALKLRTLMRATTATSTLLIKGNSCVKGNGDNVIAGPRYRDADRSLVQKGHRSYQIATDRRRGDQRLNPAEIIK